MKSRRPAIAAAALTFFVQANALGAAQPTLTAPLYSAFDVNGVNLISGSPSFQLSDLSIGAGEAGLTHTILSTGPTFGYSPLDNFFGRLAGPNPGTIWIGTTVYDGYELEFGGQSARFYKSGASYIEVTKRGWTLTDNGNGTLTATSSDGTLLTLSAALAAGGGYWGKGVVTSARYPSGRTVTMHYATDPSTGRATRLMAVTTNDGLQFRYVYSQDSRLISVTAINNAVDFCAPLAASCSLTRTWPTTTYTYSVPASGQPKIFTVTDSDGRVTRYTHDPSYRVVGVKWPSSASADNLTYTYCDNSCYTLSQNGSVVYPDMIAQVSRDGQTWSYNFQNGSQWSASRYSSISPVGGQKVAHITTVYAPQTVFVTPAWHMSNEDNDVWYMDPTDYTGRVTAVFHGQGGAEYYGYDVRGNVTQITKNPRGGSDEQQIILKAGYQSSCANFLVCNKPNWVTDGNGNQTDYTYDASHGGVLSVTGPPDADGVRPQTRYTYSQRYAWVKSSSGAYVRAPSPIWLLVTESYCRSSSYTGGGCGAGSTDEVVTTYDYGPDSGPNNLFLRGMAVTADGQTLRTCYGYDPSGNRVSETAPRAGLTACP
jgi:YD repeat-containing protein